MLAVMVVAPIGRSMDRFGPIVSPSSEGADVFWFTTANTPTQLCVGGKLYYGGANASETKVAPSCSEKVEVKALNYHAPHIDQ